MSVYKDGKTGKWRVIYRFTDYTGERKQTQKRGFETRREAVAWEHEQILKTQSSLSMTFGSFCEQYITDLKPRLKQNTWNTKEHILRTKIVPYFKNRKIAEIKSRDVVAWQNTLLGEVDEKGKKYSQTYLKTVHNQLSAIFNHAMKFYGLRENPARQAGNMGKEERKEMLFWTQEEYRKFADVMMDKPLSFYAFEMLYWCGIREGELLALTPADFDFKAGTVTINKSYQRIKGKDVITDPKTPKSNRTIQMPEFLTEEMQEYLRMLYGAGDHDRIFTITKSYLHHEMDRGAKEAGIKRVRIHDLRHSHISLLIEMGFSAVAIADRVGHESIDITTSNRKWRKKAMSAKVKDEHNRWRNKIVAFRMSPEEAEKLDRFVKISGLQKQEYLIRRVLQKEITVVGSIRTYKMLRNELRETVKELKRIETGQSVDDDLLDVIRQINTTLYGMKEDSE